jgi:hypothetical protein
MDRIRDNVSQLNSLIADGVEVRYCNIMEKIVYNTKLFCSHLSWPGGGAGGGGGGAGAGLWC